MDYRLDDNKWQDFGQRLVKAFREKEKATRMVKSLGDPNKVPKWIPLGAPTKIPQDFNEDKKQELLQKSESLRQEWKDAYLGHWTGKEEMAQINVQLLIDDENITEEDRKICHKTATRQTMNNNRESSPKYSTKVYKSKNKRTFEDSDAETRKPFKQQRRENHSTPSYRRRRPNTNFSSNNNSSANPMEDDGDTDPIVSALNDIRRDVNDKLEVMNKKITMQEMRQRRIENKISPNLETNKRMENNFVSTQQLNSQDFQIETPQIRSN